MKRFFKTNRKKTPKPPQQPIPPERPADIAAVSPSLLAELDIIPSDGGRSVSDEGLESNRTDLTVPPNEGGTIGLRAPGQDGMDGDQELPASGASTSVVAIGGTGYGNLLATEGYSNTGGKAAGPTEASTVAKKTHENTLLGGAKGNTEKFGPLKAVLEKIPGLFADRTETVAVGNTIENLLSRVVALEDCFDSPPSGVPEQRRRSDLIRKLNVIEEQLRPLFEEQELPPPTDHVQVGEDVFRLLEDLREAILSHQMAQRMATGGQGFGPIDPAEAAIINSVRCAQQAEYRHGNRNGCFRGTRTAILDEIELWTCDFDKPQVYWLNGLAGTGKSTIAQTVAERTFADGRLGASFFCSRDFEDRSNLQTIFPTLAVQLARRYTQFRSTFIQLVQSDPEIAHESLYGQMKRLIVQPLAESAVSTVIVIDALDECRDREPASAILSVLGQLVSEVPTVKFFITGRPESRIQEGFRLPPLIEATDIFVLHKVEPGQVYNDIWLFFAHGFSELKRRYRHGLEDWPTEEQVDLLCERAGGLFVYAVAAIRFVDHKINSPKKQLDRLLQSQGSGTFEGKTEFKDKVTLDSLYTSILEEAFGSDDLENDPRIRSVLGAVVLATNPLSPSAIATLLGFELGEAYRILSLIHSLLILQDDIDKPVRPFHKSFPDFVVDPARYASQRFRVCPPDQHTELLVGCLTVMNRELERNMCELPDGAINSEVPGLKEKIGEHISKALEYACGSWHKHLVGAIPAHVVPILQEFLEKKFLFWLEALSVLGAAREAIDALEAATRCEWPDASPIPNLVRDYIRFAITFFEVINASAPHIYHSALLLSPRTSITYEMHKQHTHPLAKVVQGMLISWEPVVATASFNSLVDAVWSPCNRFIAVTTSQFVGILDAVTLSQLSIFNYYTYAGGYWLLGFSPDSRRLTLCTCDNLFSWDLQTGSPLGIIPSALSPHTKTFSFEHSEDGNVVAVAYKSWDYSDPDRKYNTSIYTYNLLSRERVGSCHVPEGRMIYPIWTHNGYLQFATIDPKLIRIWQSTFTLEHPPVEVTSFPVPDGITEANRFLFLPSLSRLAFTLRDTIQVWDVKASKLLLKSELTLDLEESDFPCGSFSSNGRFFASTNTAGEAYVWEEFATSYLLHQRLPFSTPFSQWLSIPWLSPNSESIIMPLNGKIHRWRARDQDLSLSSVSTGDHNRSQFILGFSLDENFAAFAQRRGNTVTIIDLKSGELKWNVDMGVEIDCLGVTGGTVIVIGEDSIVTWNLPSGGHTFNASINDIIRTAILSPHPGRPAYMLVSPDLSRIVVTRGRPYSLEVDDVSTGSCLARTETDRLLIPWFTRDGREVWVSRAGIYSKEFEQCEVIEDGESGTVELKHQSIPHQFFQKSSYGYTVTEDSWVLSPSQKRLLWLPHRWRVSEGSRTWDGRFLGLVHGDLSEVVVLEFLE